MQITEGPRPVSNVEKAAGERATFHVFYTRPVRGKTKQFFDAMFKAQATTPEQAAKTMQAFLKQARYRNAVVTRVHVINDNA